MNITDKKFFCKAKPVWAKELSEQINCCIELECKLKYEPVTELYITGATFFQVFINGNLIHYGPARVADGYAAVDIIDLSEKISDKIGDNILLIRAMGYNCPSFACVSHTSFVCAEVRTGNMIVAATGKNGFCGYINNQHLRYTERYSYQRHFCESWDFTKERTECELELLDCDVNLTWRETVYPILNKISANDTYQIGKFIKTDSERTEPFSFVSNPNDGFFHFAKSEIESRAYDEYIKTEVYLANKTNMDFVELEEQQCARWDFDEIQAGFFCINVNVLKAARIVLAFSEQKTNNGQLDMKQLNSHNVIEWNLPKGTHTLWSCEPYTAKYAEILIFDGIADVRKPEMYELAFPDSLTEKFESKDETESEIYRAAVRTFRHNALDIFMDCPSRERAGWLFDSYYTAKAEYSFTGKTLTEDAFLKNYILGGERTQGDGMLNMCYPSDVFSKGFIPQWSMWYVIEADEYINMRNGKIQPNKFKPSVSGLINWFLKYENEFGLLERLDGWNFVEWSKVNERVWDISWATNMLYSKVLEISARLLENNDLKEKSKKLKETIRHMAFDGKLFRDRAMRTENGDIKNTDELSEVTQYYALMFDIADINMSKYSYMKNMVLNVFGTENADGELIEKANAMPGLYLRMELLLRYGMKEKLLSEIKDYFGAMAKESGTLWEHKNGNGSRDHGFASYVGAVIKDISEPK